MASATLDRPDGDVVSVDVVDRDAADPAGEGATVPAAASGRGAPLGWLLGGLVALLAFGTGLGRLHDNSFFTHLATGRLILDEGGIPRTDPYSFTAAGEPWVVQSWLASVIYAGVERIGGLSGLRLLHASLYAVIGLCLWLLTARSRSAVVRFGVAGGAVILASQLLSGRPLLFGLVGFLLVLLAAEGRLDPRWLVPVGWVWVNTHGSFPFALVLVGALAVGRRLDEGSWGPEVRVGAWAALGIVAGVLNPLGARLLVFPAGLLQRQEAFEQIVEWQAPRYGTLVQYAVLAVLMLAVCLLVRRPSWRDALPLAVFGALALTSSRNQVVLVVVLVPILAGSLPARGPSSDLRRPYLSGPRIGALVVALGALLVVNSLQQPPEALGGYPTDAIAWMEDNDLWGPDSRVVAPDFVGNLREVTEGRDARVFVDDRVDMYPMEVVRDHRTLLRANPEWPEVLDRHGITAVLWQDDTPLGGALLRDDGWEVVHHDAPWVVVVPVSSR